MKILIITRDHITDFVGGTGVYAHYVNRYLVQRGHEVHHLCYGSDKSEKSTIDGIIVIKYPRPRIKKPLFFITRLLETRRIIKNHLKNFKPDVVAFHGAETVQFLFGSGIPRQKFVYFVHAMNSHEIIFDARKQMKTACLSGKIFIFSTALFYFVSVYVFEEISLRLVSRIITVSQYDQSEIVTYHGKKYNHKITVVPIGIDLEKYCVTDQKDTVRKCLGFAESRCVFIVFRRLAPRMGLENLIDAYSKLNKLDDTLLLIGGKGAWHDSLHRQIAEYGLTQNVKLLGFVDEDIKIRYLQAADFFVLPSEELEGFGIVTLEAMACNLPVIGTSVGAIHEVISGLDESFLINNASAEAIKEKLEWAYRNREKLTATSQYRKYVEKKFNWENLIDKIENVLVSRQR